VTRYSLALLLILIASPLIDSEFTSLNVDKYVGNQTGDIVSDLNIFNSNESLYTVEMKYKLKNVGIYAAFDVTIEVCLIKNQSEWIEQAVLNEFFELDGSPVHPTFIDNGNIRKAIISVGDLSPGETKTVTVRQKVRVRSIHFDIDPEDVGTSFPEEVKKYMLPVEGLFESDSNEIVNFASSIIGDEKNPYVKAKLILEAIINYLTYEEQVEEHSALWAYYSKKGDCSDYANLFIATARAAGIPAQIVTGVGFIPLKVEKASWTDEGLDITHLGHAWVIIYLPNIGWIPVDAVWPMGIGSFGEVDSRHIVYAVSDGQDIIVNGDIIYPGPISCQVKWVQYGPTTVNIEISGGITPEIRLPVPYEWQDHTKWCGPACLAMILRYYGESVHVWDIAKNIKERGLHREEGVYGVDLINYVKKNFPQLNVKKGSFLWFRNDIWNNIKSNLTSLYPVILSVQESKNTFNYHFVVITGFNSTGVFINDPSGILFYWIYGRRLDSNIHIFVTWSELEKHVRLSNPLTPTLITIQGKPHPPLGSICIGSFTNIGNIWYIGFENKNNKDRILFIMFDQGIRWVPVEREIYVTSNDMLKINCSICNHNRFRQTYELIVSAVDFRNNIVVLDRKQFDIAKCSMITYTASFPNLDEFLVSNSQYEIRFELLTDGTVSDVVSLPPILYEPFNLTQKYFPYLIFDSNEEYFPTDFFYDDTDITNNTENYDNASWPLTAYIHITDGIFEDKEFWVIEYWFYYVRDSKLWDVDVPFIGAHEHDWESLYVFLQKEDLSPVYITYFHHLKLNLEDDCYCTFMWNATEVDKIANHPIVYVAKNSHASYPHCYMGRFVWCPAFDLPELCDGGLEKNASNFKIKFVNHIDSKWPQKFGEIKAPWSRTRWNNPAIVLKGLTKHNYTLVSLDETQSKLYLHVYDKYSRHIGFNSTNNIVEIEITGAKYFDLNSTIVIVLPPNLTEFICIVDAKFAECQSEYYRLLISSVNEGKTIQEKLLSDIIQKGAIKEYSVTITNKGIIVEEKTENQLFWLIKHWYLIVLLIVIISSIVVILFIKKKKDNITSERRTY